MNLNTALVGLWALAAIILAWTFVPALLASIGGTRFLNGETPEGWIQEPPASEVDYAYWRDQLLELGYELLGDAWVRIDFAGENWSLRSRERVFRNPSKHCYAIMQKAAPPFNFWPGVIFATCWADGRLLTTDNNLAADPHPDDEFIRQGMVGLTLDPVEEFHLATMEALRRTGAKADPELTLETLLQSCRQHFGVEARRHYGRQATQYLFAHGLIHICLSTPIVYVMGMGHWSVPLANIVLALLLMFGESSQKRQYALAAREALGRERFAPGEKRGDGEDER
jgi:hypothetical protein